MAEYSAKDKSNAFVTNVFPSILISPEILSLITKFHKFQILFYKFVNFTILPFYKFGCFNIHVCDPGLQIAWSKVCD